MRILLIIASIVLTSCSAEWHLKRAIKKDPSILKPITIVVLDTIIIRDSIIGIDTFVMMEIDTMVIEKEGIKTQIIRYKNRFIVKQEIKSDTIFRSKEIRVPQIIYQKASPKYYIWVIAFLMAILTLILVKKIAK
jgi:hypothetical protein